MKKSATFLPLITIALISTACSTENTSNQNINKNIRKENINVTRNDEGFSTSFNGKRTNAQGVIIGQEIDENGNMRDCAMGVTGQQIGIPSCDSIIAARVANDKNNAAQRNFDRDRRFNNKLSGSKLFTLPDGSKIRISTRVVYSQERNLLTIEAIVDRVNATAKAFENLFINRPNARIVLGFMDDTDFEHLSPLTIPLNIDKGQRKNISYRKKMGLTTSEVEGIKIQARKPIASLYEYDGIARVDVAFAP